MGRWRCGGGRYFLEGEGNINEDVMHDDTCGHRLDNRVSVCVGVHKDDDSNQMHEDPVHIPQGRRNHITCVDEQEIGAE